MNRTHQRLLLASLVGAGLLAYFGYAGGLNNRLTLPHPRRTGILAPHDSEPADPQERTAGSTGAGQRPAIRPDLFSAPPPPQPPLNTVAAVPAPRLPAPAVSTPPDPLGDYVYSGWVSVNGEMSALIEARKSRQGWYVKAGESWQNYRILSITDQQITLLVDGQERLLARSDAINLVPLKADAGQASSGSLTAANTDASKVLYEDTMRLNLNTMTDWVSSKPGLSEAEIARIKDDAFEGRITGEEAERRLSQGRTAATILMDIDADVSNSIERWITVKPN